MEAKTSTALRAKSEPNYLLVVLVVWSGRSRFICDMIVRVVDYDYPFWFYGFQVNGDKSGRRPAQVKAIFESINGVAMERFYCLTPWM